MGGFWGGFWSIFGRFLVGAAAAVLSGRFLGRFPEVSGKVFGRDCEVFGRSGGGGDFGKVFGKVSGEVSGEVSVFFLGGGSGTDPTARMTCPGGVGPGRFLVKKVGQKNIKNVIVFVYFMDRVSLRHRS